MPNKPIWPIIKHKHDHQPEEGRKEEQTMERKNAWAAYAGDDGRVEAFAKAYCDFINNGKTERECVAYG